MIFQDALRCLNPAFTVGDQIAEVVRTHEDITRAQAQAVLEHAKHAMLADAK